MLTLVEAPDLDTVALGPDHEVNRWHGDDGRTVAYACVSGPRRWIHWVGLGVFVFDGLSRPVQVRLAPGASRTEVADAFSRVLQPIFLQAAGFECLHASAALVSNVVIALVGPKHSGKSTVAYAMGRAGFTHFADDAVVLACEDRVIAHALPFAARLRPSAKAHFDVQVQEVEESSDRTRALRPGSAPLGTIVLLRQDPAAEVRHQIRRVDPRDAFLSLLRHGYMFDLRDSHERQRVVEHFLAVVSSVPVFELAYHPNFAGLPDLVASVASLASPVRPPAELEPV